MYIIITRNRTDIFRQVFSRKKPFRISRTVSNERSLAVCIHRQQVAERNSPWHIDYVMLINMQHRARFVSRSASNRWCRVFSGGCTISQRNFLPSEGFPRESGIIRPIPTELSETIRPGLTQCVNPIMLLFRRRQDRRVPPEVVPWRVERYINSISTCASTSL